MTRIFISIIFLAAAVVLFFSRTQTYFTEIKDLRAQMQTYDEALTNSREFQVLKDSLLTKYNNISQGDLNRLAKLLPAQVNSGDLIVILEERAKAYGLSLKKIDVNESATGAVLKGGSLPYKTVNLTLQVAGPYVSFLKLLSDLEREIRLIDVSMIKFSAAQADAYEFEIGAETYASLASASPLKLDGDDDFLVVLNRLRSIKIDQEFFNSDIFKSFSDFAGKLEIPETYGRTNPFAPL